MIRMIVLIVMIIMIITISMISMIMVPLMKPPCHSFKVQTHIGGMITE